MIRLVADENFNNNIIRGLLRKNPNIDIIRIQDVGLSGCDDPTVLAWAAENNRILLTHDVSTITRYAYDRIAENKPMPGVIEVRFDIPIQTIIEDILLIVNCSLENEWENQIRYIPL